MKRKTITKLISLLLMITLLFSALIACNNDTQEDQKNDNTPEFSGVFSAEDGDFFISGGEVYKSESGKLAFSLSAVLTEEYYNELKSTYGNSCEFTFYTYAGKIVDSERQTLKEALIPSVSLSFTVEDNVSKLVIEGDVEIDGYGFSEQEFLDFFGQSYFGEMFLTVKYTNQKGKTAYDKITAYGKETFDAYAPGRTTVKIAQFNVFILKTIEVGSIILTEDVDLKGIDWDPTANFTGTFDGDYHLIKNLKSKAQKGLFANVNGGTVIKNVGFVNAETAVERSAVVCGIVRGSLVIENVFAHIVGNVCAYSGLVYYSVFEVSFDNVFVHSEARGATNYAGIFLARAGNNLYTFRNCIGVYSTGTYNGLFGTNNPDIQNNRPGVLGERVVDGELDVDYFIFDSIESVVQSPAYFNMSEFIQRVAFSSK